MRIATVLLLALSSAAAAQDWKLADERTSRLSPDEFPQMPAAVRADLKRRGCLIPQTSDDSMPHNVVVASFIRPGSHDWAVLCSVKRASTAFIYHDGATAVIDTMGTSLDIDFLQGIGNGRVGFSRRIMKVDIASLRQHARDAEIKNAPKFDHEGFEDAFVGKASAISYCHKGKWMSVGGAN